MGVRASTSVVTWAHTRDVLMVSGPTIREANVGDAEEISALFNGVIAEDLPWFSPTTDALSITDAIGTIARCQTL